MCIKNTMKFLHSESFPGTLGMRHPVGKPVNDSAWHVFGMWEESGVPRGNAQTVN